MKIIEVYAFLHSFANGTLTVTPRDSDSGKAHLPINEVEFTTVANAPRKILLRIPEYLASAKNLMPKREAYMSFDRTMEAGLARALSERDVMTGTGKIEPTLTNTDPSTRDEIAKTLRVKPVSLKSHIVQPIEKRLQADALTMESDLLEPGMLPMAGGLVAENV